MNRLTKRVDFIQNYLDGIFAEDLHAKRVMSLANGTLGVMTSASLAVSIIGQSLAQARGLLSKHAVKQVDRLLSNQGIVVWDMFAPWVAEVVGQRKTIVVAMDWTDFDADDQTTLALGGESTRYGVEAASAAIARRRRRPRDRAGPDRPEWILVWSGWTCERSRDNVAAFAPILCALGPRRPRRRVRGTDYVDRRGCGRRCLARR